MEVRGRPRRSNVPACPWRAVVDAVVRLGVASREQVRCDTGVLSLNTSTGAVEAVHGDDAAC